MICSQTFKHLQNDLFADNELNEFVTEITWKVSGHDLMDQVGEVKDTHLFHYIKATKTQFKDFQFGILVITILRVE